MKRLFGSTTARAVSLAVGLVLGCAACVSEPRLMYVQPGPVVDHDGDVSASIKLVEGYRMADDQVIHQVGIKTLGHGGGCLVTDLGGQNMCTTPANCDAETLHPDGFAYCLQPEGMPAKTCWYKGYDPAWCFKAKPDDPDPPLQLNKVVTLPAPYYKGDIQYSGPLQSAAMHNGREAHYLVLTCTAGFDDATQQDTNDCGDGGPKKLFMMGKPTKVLGRFPPLPPLDPSP